MAKKGFIHELHFQFTGNDMERDAFFRPFRDTFIPFLKRRFPRANWQQMYSLMKEILKNIYDHADGKGEAYILYDAMNRHLYFEIRDFGTKSYDLEALRKAGTSKKTEYNRGLGLAFMIFDLAKGLYIPLKVDASHGFTYIGTYRDIERCDLNLPTFDIFLTPRQEACPCMLLHHYSDGHVSALPNGKVIEWEFAPCDFCDEDECECFDYNELTPEEVEKRKEAVIAENMRYLEEIRDEIEKKRKKKRKDKVPA